MKPRRFDGARLRRVYCVCCLDGHDVRAWQPFERPITQLIEEWSQQPFPCRARGETIDLNLDLSVENKEYLEQGSVKDVFAIIVSQHHLASPGDDLSNLSDSLRPVLANIKEQNKTLFHYVAFRIFVVFDVKTQREWRMRLKQQISLIAESVFDTRKSPIVEGLIDEFSLTEAPLDRFTDLVMVYPMIAAASAS